MILRNLFHIFFFFAYCSVSRSRLERLFSRISNWVPIGFNHVRVSRLDSCLPRKRCRPWLRFEPVTVRVRTEAVVHSATPSSLFMIEIIVLLTHDVRTCHGKAILTCTKNCFKVELCQTIWVRGLHKVKWGTKIIKYSDFVACDRVRLINR